MGLTSSIAALWIAALGALLLVYALVPPAARLWRSLGHHDREVSLRKIHVGEVPRVGGIVLVLGTGTLILIGLAGTSPLSATHELFSRSPLTGALVGALVAAIAGVLDDLVGLRASLKLALHVAAAAAAIACGLEWPALRDLLAGVPWAPELITGLFLVASVNALNLMDGLDGLAAGIAAIGLGVVLGAALQTTPEPIPLLWVATAALGATLGFLLHNRHPARVFMGDTGSYFLGFLLAGLLLQIEPVRERVAIVRLSIPLLVLALPLFDLALAVGRRLVRGQSVFASDSDHVHHRLLAAGLSHGRAVAVLWLSTAMFAALGYLNVLGVGGWWTLLGTVVAMIVAAVLLGYHRLLGRLPAFTGRRTTSWQDRRREVMEILAQIDRLAGEVDDRGEARHRRLGPELQMLLARLGVPAFEIRTATRVTLSLGDPSETWAWLDLPLNDGEGSELRLGLAVRLPQLQQEQLVLLERITALAAGRGVTERVVVRAEASPTAPYQDANS